MKYFSLISVKQETDVKPEKREVDLKRLISALSCPLCNANKDFPKLSSFSRSSSIFLLFLLVSQQVFSSDLSPLGLKYLVG